MILSLRLVSESPRNNVALAFVEACEMLQVLKKPGLRRVTRKLKDALAADPPSRSIDEVRWGKFKSALEPFYNAVSQSMPTDLLQLATELEISTDDNYESPFSIDQKATEGLIATLKLLRRSSVVLLAVLPRWREERDRRIDSLRQFLDLSRDPEISSQLKTLINQNQSALEEPTKLKVEVLYENVCHQAEDSGDPQLKSLADKAGQYLDAEAKTRRVEFALLLLENTPLADVVFNPRTRIAQYILSGAHGKNLSEDAIEESIKRLGMEGLNGGKYKDYAPLYRELWEMEHGKCDEVKLGGKSIGQVTSGRSKLTDRLSVKNACGGTRKRKQTGSTSEPLIKRLKSG